MKAVKTKISLSYDLVLSCYKESELKQIYCLRTLMMAALQMQMQSSFAQVNLEWSHQAHLPNNPQVSYFANSDMVEDYQHNFYFFSQQSGSATDISCVTKVNSSGNVLWQKCVPLYFFPTGGEQNKDIDSTGIYVLTLTLVSGYWHTDIVKYDFDLDSLWTKNINSYIRSGSPPIDYTQIKTDQKGGLYYCDYFYYGAGSYTSMAFGRISQNGDSLWKQSVNPTNGLVGIQAVHLDIDKKGNPIINCQQEIGYLYPVTQIDTGCLLKFDTLGNLTAWFGMRLYNTVLRITPWLLAFDDQNKLIASQGNGNKVLILDENMNPTNYSSLNVINGGEINDIKINENGSILLSYFATNGSVQYILCDSENLANVRIYTCTPNSPPSIVFFDSSHFIYACSDNSINASFTSTMVFTDVSNSMVLQRKDSTIFGDYQTSGNYSRVIDNHLLIFCNTSLNYHSGGYPEHLTIEKYCLSCPNKISGHTYFDFESLCHYDSTSIALPKAIVKLEPYSIYVLSNDSGTYHFGVDSGQYQIDARSIFPRVCDTMPAPVYLSDSLPVNGVDFAFYIDASLRDLNISTECSRVRLNTSFSNSIQYANHGFFDAQGVVELQLDSTFTYSHAIPAEDSVSGHSYFWHFDSLKLMEQRNISFYATPTVLGHHYQNVSIIHDYTNDINPIDNFDTCQGIVLGSWDPNEKTVFPVGDGIDHITNMDNRMAYEIEFQNTGNDTAHIVTVVDTLDANLDISTLSFGISSHPFDAQIEGNRVLVLTFNNIMLADSHTNMSLSTGFVKYYIYPKKNLHTGTRVSNTADIYFDYNAPVKTNKVFNTFGMPNGISEAMVKPNRISIYPNPARDKFLIKSEKNMTAVQVYDMTGKLICNNTTTSKAAVIDASNYSRGVYIVRVSDVESNMTTHKVVIE